MPNHLIVPRHDASLFMQSEDCETHYTAEASMLGGVGTRLDGRVWSDAADVGFVIRDFNGKDVLFVLSETKMDSDGDVQWWAYTSHCLSVPVSVIVYND